MRSYSLKKKVIIGCSAIVLLGMSALGFEAYVSSADIASELLKGDLVHRLEEIRSANDLTYDDNIERVKTLSKKVGEKYLSRLKVNDNLKTPLEIQNQVTKAKSTVEVPTLFIGESPLAGQEFVDSIHEQTDAAATVFVTVPQGLLRVSTSVRKEDGSRATGTYIPLDSPVYQAVSSQQPYFGRAFVVNDWFITAYEPIVQDGRVVGALFVGVPDKSYKKLKENLKAKKIFDSGYYFALDSKGTMVLHPALEDKNMLEETDLDGRHIFREMIEKKSGVLEYRWKGTDGAIQEKLAFFIHLKAIDWHLAASLNKAEAYASIGRLRNVIIIWTLVVTLITAAIVGAFANRLINHLSKMSQNLQARSGVINAQSEHARASSENLGAASTEQAASVQETAAALEEINATVQKNLSAALAAEQVSTKNQSEVDTGFEVMKQLERSVEDVKREAANMQDVMAESFKRIRHISNVINGIENKTKSINDVVFQTKLLSFNASVEAARAGEQGKGFSVVAEEVGRLAALTGTIAIEIQNSLLAATKEVSEIIETSEHSVKSRVAASQERISEVVNGASRGYSSFATILEGAKEIRSSIESISLASREQAVAIAEISSAIHEIDTATQENNKIALEATTLSQNLDAQSQELERISTELGALVHGVKVSSPEAA